MSSGGGGQSRLGLYIVRPVAGTMSYAMSAQYTVGEWGGVGIRTVSVLWKILGNEWCKSHQGDTSTPPAGGGRPASRTTCKKARESPPPAESPPTTMWLGLMGRCAAPGGGSMRKRSGGNM